MRTAPRVPVNDKWLVHLKTYSVQLYCISLSVSDVLFFFSKKCVL